ncbi:MAG TPA: AraC family transcriptional regulator [Nitrospira sp.]|nr:AraC family transcriptional regulator [Nitrospira sp.]
MRRGAVVFGNVLYQPGGICGPRTQHDYQLVVIHRGSLRLKLDQEIIQVSENHGILLCPGHQEHFSFATDCETYHSWCAIEPRAVPVVLRRQFQKFRGPIPFLGRMATLLDMGKTTPLLSKDKDEELEDGFYQGLALALMSDFAITVRKGRVILNSADSVFSRMNHFIADQYAQPLTLGDIARASGVSRQHLHKICRISGMSTPMQQLYNKRLEIAADLLLHTGFSVGEIADQCGFVNVFHFSRRFKETYRRSPLVWRNALWKTTEQQ